MQMITVNELFSGIGAFRKALERLNIPHKIIGISEIDEHAINSYEAIFGATRNYGDISRVNKLDYADMWTYGFPCQDISICGQQAGIIKGETRSGLLYEVQRLLVSAALLDELPRYLILENVKNLVGKKFKNDFHSWLEWLSAMGYHNYWQVINAKDCGIPQNRERVFVVSIRKDIDEGFSFPEKIPLTITMHDLSETEVEEKFYPPPTIFDSSEFDEALMVSDAKASLAKCIGGIGEKKSNGGKQYYQQDRVYAGDIALAHPAQITGGSYYYAIKEPRDKNAPWISSKGVKYILSPKRGMCTDVNADIIQPLTAKGQSNWTGSFVSPDIETLEKHTTIGGTEPVKIKLKNGETITSDDDVSHLRIRRLTPRECWRLMGFDDTDFEKAEKVCSNSQLYKQAGNSIVVNVLMGILNNLLGGDS